MAQRAYLDWNATAPLRPQARAAVVAALEMVGNPSSVHAEGRRARHLIEDAREKVARLTGAEAAGVTFTSGATEANALALHPALEIAGARVPRDRLLVSAIEHVSVLKGGRFPADAIEVIPVTESGFVDCEALRRLLRQSARPLVSVMLANNETGVVQPIRDIAAIVHEADGLLHVDAVQGPGRIGVNLSALGADMMSLSAHKIGGPKGVGALVRRPGLHIAVPMIAAGGQERGLRGGTENVPGIAGFGAAAEAVQQSFAEEVALLGALRERLEAGLRAAAPEVVIFGSAAQYGLFLRSRHEGRNRRHRLRSRRHRRLRGRGLFVRPGATLPCSGRNGRSAGAGAGRGAGQPRRHQHAGRNRSIPRRLEKAIEIIS